MVFLERQMEKKVLNSTKTRRGGDFVKEFGKHWSRQISLLNLNQIANLMSILHVIECVTLNSSHISIDRVSTVVLK